jgi:hypothetical protein
VSLGKDQIDQDALAAEWGVVLETDAASADAPGGEGVPEGSELAASQWAAMVDEGTNFMLSAKGGAERILNQEESQTAKSMIWMKNTHWGSGGGNRLNEYPLLIAPVWQTLIPRMPPPQRAGVSRRGDAGRGSRHPSRPGPRSKVAR